MKVLNNTALGQVVDLRLFAFLIIILFSHLTMAGQVNEANEVNEVNLTQLKDDGIKRWETKSFVDTTKYTLGDFHQQLSLKAFSRSAASGLVLKKAININKTPYINWRWLIENRLTPLAERTKKGDDFAARIYVVIDGGWRFWNTLSLNYVWSSNQAEGLVWDNPFAGANVKMLSVRGQDSAVATWYEERRNVYNDLIAVFGDKGSEEANREAYSVIDVVAIMTDTDNSEKEVTAYYGDIVFSAF